MRLGGEDHVVAAVEPMADQRRNQAGRMLAVAVHEQHGAKPGVIEARHQRRLLAEVARQRHDLHVEHLGRQAVGDRKAVVAAAVVDIDHFGRKPARLAQLPRDLDQAIVQPRKAGALVEHRHDDRQPGFGPALSAPVGRHRSRVGSASRPCSWVRSIAHDRAIYSATASPVAAPHDYHGISTAYAFRFAAPRKRSKRCR